MKNNNDVNHAGFKLQRFEIYNWGTFDQIVHVIEPKRFSALLTGENGSGKSTLVDALLTLLVPNIKRNYNLASGNEKKERTELTYVRGAYAREQNDLGTGQTKFLRKEEDYSILLAKFQNELTSDSIIIGQFFWFEQTTLHKFFFVSHADISIQEHFSQIKNAKEARNRLKQIHQTTLFTTFSEYQSYFIRYVGLRSEKGLDLFNQITAIKEINRLNEFVRKHMLNANETQELLNSLYANYQNLELAYKVILLSKNQLDELNPLVEEAKKFELTQSKLVQFQKESHTLPYYFASHKKEALGAKQSEFSQKLTESEAELKAIDFKLQSMNEHKLELSRLFSQDETGQELEKLDLILNQYEEKRKYAQKQADYYAKLAETLDLAARPSLKDFSKNLEKCKSARSSTETQLVELRNQHYINKKEQENHLKEIEGLIAEVQSLKNRKNRLPMNLIQVRDELMQTLGVSSNNLPFIAELIKVQDPAWEGAIEKLLHSYALRMLVPHDLYAEVCKLLNRKNIGIRLVFQKVDEQLAVKLPPLNQVDASKLIHKLEFRNNSPFVPWLKEQIFKNYDYSCVNDLAIFQKQFKAMTSEGLVKHGMSLNEKDDRFSINDKNRFILGWDNQEKLDWLLKEIKAKQTLHDNAIQSVQSIERLISRTESELRAMQELCKIDDFSSMDWQSVASEIDKVRKRQSTLSANHSSGRIQKDLQNLEKEIRTHQDSRDKYLKEIAVLNNSMQELTQEVDYCEKMLNQLGKSLEESEWVKAFMKKRKLNFAALNLRDYALWEKTAIDELNDQIYKLDAEKQHHQVVVVRKMTQFKTRFSEHAVDLDTTIESLPGYLDLQNKLQTESLPEHERRFRKLLNKSVMNDMAAFKSTLDLAYEDIEGTIQELNRVLIGMNYSHNSYVQLQLTRNKDVEIREFHHLLKYALLDVKGEGDREADHEVFFERIKTLLDRLKNDERWCKKVIDVRNWADFAVLERIRETDVQKNYYSDSAGLSGGQKAKLAFTILGSAIAYQYGLYLESANSTKRSSGNSLQYGLDLESSQPIKKSSGNSFRFIMIDEAFSKSDEKNSRYAMELFHNLGLQVMVVTPKDKIQVVEPYIRSIFLTHVKEGEDRSQLISLGVDPTGKRVSNEGSLNMQPEVTGRETTQ